MKSNSVKRVLLSAFALLLILVSLMAFAWYFLNDEVFVEQQLASRLATGTGWQLEIDGDLKINWGRSSVIEARDLRLSNPHFSAQPEMISVARLQLTLQPLELINSKLLINELGLADCQAYYTENADGVANWAVAGGDDGSKPQPQPGAQSKFEWAVNQLDISSCKLNVSSAKHQHPVEIQLDQARLYVDEKENLVADIEGKLDRQTMSMKGKVSPLTALWEGGHVQHEIQLQAGEIKLHSEGDFEELYSGDGANLKFQFTGPEFSEVTQWLALPDISSGPFDASLKLKEQADSGNMNITVDASLGSMEIIASGQLDRIVKPAAGEIDMQVRGPDLDALARTFGQHGLVADSYELKLKAAIEDSKTDLQLLSLSTAKDHIEAKGTLGPWPAMLDSKIAISVHNPDLARWLPPGKSAQLFSSFDSEIDLSKTESGEIMLQIDGELGRFTHPGLPFTLKTGLLRQDPQWQVRQLDLKVGKDSLSLAGKLNLQQAFQNSDITAQLQLPDLAATARIFGLQDMPSQPLEISAQLSRPGDGLKFKVTDSDLGGLNIHMSGTVPDIQQPLAISSHFDLDLPSLALARFLFPGTPLPDLPFSIEGEVSLGENQQTRLRDVALNLGQTQAKINARLELSKQLIGSSADISISGADLRELWPQAPQALEFGHFSLTGNWQRQPEGDFFKAVKFNSVLGSVDLSAQIDDLAKPEHIDLSVDLKSPDASRFNVLLGPVFSDQAVDLSFTASGKPTHFSSSDLRLQQGKNMLTAELEFSSDARPHLSGKINATAMDLVPVQQHSIKSEQSRSEQNGQQATDGDARVEKAQQTREILFTDQPIDFLGKTPLDLSLVVQADKVLLVNNELMRLKLAFDLQQQLLEVHSLSFEGYHGGHYSAQVSSRKSGQVTELKVLAKAQDLKLGMIGVSGQDPASLPSSDLVLDLSGSGHSWHSLAPSLTGKLRWYAGPGQVSNSGLNFIFSDLMTQVFSTLNPLSRKSQFTDLNCGVYAADFVDGQIRLAPVVMQTKQVTAFSEGTIDLDTEEINLNFRTVARKGLGISAGNVVNPFFRIGGTLMKPALQLDVTKGAISSGTMVATAGLSVIFKSVTDRLLASADPCGDARRTIEQRDSVVAGH